MATALLRNARPLPGRLQERLSLLPLAVSLRVADSSYTHLCDSMQLLTVFHYFKPFSIILITADLCNRKAGPEICT